jgi:NitT/TauT family transport system ATP-binding protein
MSTQRSKTASPLQCMDTRRRADEALLLTKRPTRVAEILRYDDPRPRTVATRSEPGFVATRKLSLDIFQREVRR